MSIKSKESVYLGFEQTLVEPVSFKWTGPGFSLCLLTAFTKRETGFKSLFFFKKNEKNTVFNDVLVHLVMLGTMLVTELQRESRPIFSMQPVMRRKKRKAPLKPIITLIHMRSLQTGEKQHLYFERIRCRLGFSTPFIPSYHTSFRSHLLLSRCTRHCFTLCNLDKDRCGTAPVTSTCPRRCRRRTASRATARSTPPPR